MMMIEKDQEIYTAGFFDPKAPPAPPKNRADMEAERRAQRTAEVEGLAAAVERAGREIGEGLGHVASAISELTGNEHKPHTVLIAMLQHSEIIADAIKAASERRGAWED